MSHTGTPQPAPYPQSHTPAPAQNSNGLATAGFVLGLIALLICWIPFINFLAMLLGTLGVILAGVGLVKSKTVGAGKGIAITGLVLGGLAVVFALVINAVFFSGVDEAIDETTGTSVEVPSSAKDGVSPGDEPEADDAAEPEEEIAADDEADEELGTTRANPVPIGSKIHGGDWTVTINSVKTARSDSLGRTPDAGQILLQVNMTATYNGDDEQGSSAWVNLKFVTAEGTTIDATDGIFIADDSFDSLKKIYGGASVTGDELIAVPADGWKRGVLAVSPGLWKDDTFVAVD